MNLAQRMRHRRHANPFALRGPVSVPNWPKIFGRQAPLAIDIGCGTGLFACLLAKAHPEWDVVAIDIRQFLIDACQSQAKSLQINNLHARKINANLQLPALLPAQSVAFVSINFPDPWYKKRHHKRRVVQVAWLHALLPSLLPQAQMHVMSDYKPISLQMRDTIESVGEPLGLTNVYGTGNFAPDSTTGLASEREILHLKRGEPIYRLQFTYRLAKHDVL